ncbi:hypothetical protein GCM10009545_05100 [Saccharopolyspora thermophila]|uniref:Uncharacterized protein n=1 Tax=Saccharopolyspora thermophila TaxID=89367 RepID=A0ABN1BUQ4_9PSEU
MVPGPSMVSLLPREWLVTGSDEGAFYVLGGALAGDPDVMIRVEQASGGGRDLTESVGWLLAELLAASGAAGGICGRRGCGCGSMSCGGPGGRGPAIWRCMMRISLIRWCPGCGR